MTDRRVRVEKVLCDTETGACVVLLKEEDGSRVLPIWIGQSEAFAIAVAAENVKLPRPITHDLIKTLLESQSVALDWIRVVSIEEGTYFAAMRLNGPLGTKDIDCRPSDGIAIAMRFNAPIFVDEGVLKLASDPLANITEKLENLAGDLLANLPDEVFGKYKM